MATWRNTGMVCLPFAVALLASTVGCAGRSNALTASTECTTCHGQPPAKDAHAIHFNADTGTDPDGGIPHAQFECLQCHRDIESVNQPDHILRADGAAVPTPAEVRFDDAEAIASSTQQGASRAAAPIYDKAARTCSNVYCHGAGLKGAGASATPAWGAAQGSVTCGTCHGIPPADHPAGLTPANCTQCHGDAIDASGKPNPAKHVNGTVDLATGVTTSCSACHGDRTVNTLPGDPRSAPPTDAEGRPASNTDATSIGAHQNHVVAGVLGAAVACSECHAVPDTLFAAGHFDGQVTVTFGPLASKGGLTPTYKASDQTCSNVYCHGNFPFSKTTLPPLAPTWRGGTAAIACGSCHDLPPPVPAHRPVDVVAQGCSTSTVPALACHPAPSAGKPGYSFDPATGTGTVDPALHIDGKVCPPFCSP